MIHCMVPGFASWWFSHFSATMPAMRFKLYTAFITPYNISKALFLLRLLQVTFSPLKALDFVCLPYQLTVSTAAKSPPKGSATSQYCT